MSYLTGLVETCGPIDELDIQLVIMSNLKVTVELVFGTSMDPPPLHIVVTPDNRRELVSHPG